MKITLFALSTLIAASAAYGGQMSQDADRGQAAGTDHTHAPAAADVGRGGSVPTTEGGQAAFAALTEIVARLEGDPATDWAKVDIAGLRDHLIDMDNVVMRTDVQARAVPGGATFVVTPHDERARQSLERMVRLHSAMANREGRYRYSSSADGGQMTVTVLASKPEDANRLRGLGFHGLLTDGVHHQRHHWAMARGISMH